MNNKMECIVCIKPMEIINTVTFDMCNHSFCIDCAKKWLSVNPTCPLDRTTLTSIKFYNETSSENSCLTGVNFINGCIIEKWEKILFKLYEEFKEVTDTFISYKQKHEKLFDNYQKNLNKLFETGELSEISKLIKEYEIQCFIIERSLNFEHYESKINDLNQLEMYIARDFENHENAHDADYLYSLEMLKYLISLYQDVFSFWKGYFLYLDTLSSSCDNAEIRHVSSLFGNTLITFNEIYASQANLINILAQNIFIRFQVDKQNYPKSLFNWTSEVPETMQTLMGLSLKDSKFFTERSTQIIHKIDESVSIEPYYEDLLNVVYNYCQFLFTSTKDCLQENSKVRSNEIHQKIFIFNIVMNQYRFGQEHIGIFINNLISLLDSDIIKYKSKEVSNLYNFSKITNILLNQIFNAFDTLKRFVMSEGNHTEEKINFLNNYNKELLELKMYCQNIVDEYKLQIPKIENCIIEIIDVINKN